MMDFDFMAMADSIADDTNAKQQTHFNYWAYKKDRDWQEQMANSAVQRHVSDLRAAGLNPMLGYSGQASSPATSAPKAAGKPPSNMAAGMHSAAQARLTNAQVGLIDAQKGQIQASTAYQAAETKKLLDLLPAMLRSAGGEAARKEFGRETLEGARQNEQDFWRFLNTIGSKLGGTAYEVQENFADWYKDFKRDVDSGKYKTKEK